MRSGIRSYLIRVLICFEVAKLRDAGAGGRGRGAARPPTLEHGGDVAPNFCTCESAKVFHNGRYKVNRKFAEKSWCI